MSLPRCLPLLLLALPLSACDAPTSASDAATVLDAQPTQPDVVDTEAPVIDASSAPDIPVATDLPSPTDTFAPVDQPAADVTPDAGPPDPCATDNGGCGPTTLFTCRAATPAVRCLLNPAADHAALTDGVRTLNLGTSLASALVVHGDAAFPVVYDANHVTFVAAGRAGTGRFIEWGHEGLLNNPRNTTDDRGRLVLNAARWAAQGRTNPVIGVDGTRTELRAFLTEQGFTVRSATIADLDAVHVFITDAGASRTREQSARLQAWVRAGGGLLMGGHAWYWGYSNTGPVENFTGNHVLHDLGVTITTDADPTGNVAVPVRAPTDFEHAGRALERVLDHVEGRTALSMGDQVLASATVRRAVRVEPLDSAYFDLVRRVRARLPDVVPTTAMPVRPAMQPIAALTVIIDTRIALDTPVAMLQRHPAADDFPGALNATPTTVTRTLDLRYAGRTNRLGGNSDRAVWRSTGLYAAPGARVTVTVPQDATSVGLSVLVGAWTDDNTGTEAWTRMPVVTRAFPITATSTLVGSAFGGNVYVRVPSGVTLGAREVRFEGAVAAPRFVLGTTTVEQWRSERALPGLYAELETQGVVLTVPSALVRAVDDPTALMEFWQRVMDVDADLGGFSRTRPRAERIVFDRQIVAGYMHAGYPIMAFTPQAAESLDLATLRRSGNWGFFHELGHNHQFADWSWSGTGECTTNLWSLYAMEMASGQAPGTGHSEVTPARRSARIAAYVAGGRNFARDWSVWTCLDTFSQLREGFGWTLFQRLNAEYLALPEGERPGNEAARIQRWIVRSSVVAGRNLAPFYAAWGFAVEDATRAAVVGLPAWAEDPMR